MSFSSENLVCHVPSVVNDLRFSQNAPAYAMAANQWGRYKSNCRDDSHTIFLVLPYNLRPWRYKFECIHHGSNMRASELKRHVRGRHAGTHDWTNTERTLGTRLSNLSALTTDKKWSLWGGRGVCSMTTWILFIVLRSSFNNLSHHVNPVIQKIYREIKIRHKKLE